MRLGSPVSPVIFSGSAGFIPQPTLDIDLRNGTLPMGSTFTRASTGTYFNSAGVLTTAATDQPRFDYNPTTLEPRGLLIEGQRTNYLLYSDDMSNAVWPYTNITTTAVSEGYKLTLTGATSLTHLFLQNSSITSGLTYTDYIVVKPNGYPYGNKRVLRRRNTGY